MVEKRGLKELERGVALVLAQSFRKVKFLQWSSVKPDGASASLNVEVEDPNSVLVFLDYKGSALVMLNGEAFWSLDGYHKSVEMQKGKHEEDEPSVRYETMIHILESMENESFVGETGRLIGKRGWAANILGSQKESTYWDNPYSCLVPKWSTCVWGS